MHHAALGNARRAAGFEDVDRLVRQALRHPAAHRAAAQPIVFEQRELLQVVEALHFLERVEVEYSRFFCSQNGEPVDS